MNDNLVNNTNSQYPSFPTPVQPQQQGYYGPTSQVNQDYSPAAPINQQPVDSGQSPEVIASPQSNEAVRPLENTKTQEQAKPENLKEAEPDSARITDKKIARPPNPDQDNVEPQTSEEILGIKLSGYSFSTQLANARSKIPRMSGRGSAVQSKSWLIMLLDRLLKKENLL